jgi:hypothetical protein
MVSFRAILRSFFYTRLQFRVCACDLGTGLAQAKTQLAKETLALAYT